MGTLWQDLRYAVRVLVKQPAFTIVAILTLALGIGANSAIFSVVNAVLLRPLSLNEPENLVNLNETLPQGSYGSVSVPNLLDWREQNDVLTGIAAYQYSSFGLQAGDHPERVLGATVTANFFDVLRTSPQMGRAFYEGEDSPGSDRVVIISDQLWKRNFGADPELVGKSISLGGESYSVVGVMPAGFRFPSQSTELWVPLAFTPGQLASRGSHWLFTIGRLRLGVTLEQAQEQMSAIGSRLAEQYPNQQTGRNIRVALLQEDIVSNTRPALLMLLAAVGFVLLIACTNVANLLLARATARRREIAIRTALGAGRWRLVRQFLTESVVLSLAGGALGLFLARWGVDALVALARGILPRASEVGLDGRVLGFTLLLSVVTGIAFGLVPAFQVSRTDVQGALKDGGSAGSSPHRNWVRSLLVVAEVSSALVLLVGAGLLIKSFVRLQQVDPGFQPENVMTVKISLPDARYKTAQSAAAFFQQVLDRVSALPGVQAAGAIHLLPVQEYGTNGEISIEGQQPDPSGRSPLVEFRNATPDYFRALGIPLIAGRFFTAQDQENSDRVAIINQALARRLIPDEDPIGKRILGAGPAPLTIVGMVGDVRQSGLISPVRPEFFVPHTQSLWAGMVKNMTVVVRTASNPASIASAIRGEVLAVDPSQPIYNVQTMEKVIAASVASQRLNMLLLGVFAAVAMILAVIGIYSVMSYTVQQNTREIGIRMALGARPSHVMRLVVGHGLLLAVIGVVIGVAAAFALTRLMESLLFAVSATDPSTYVAVSGLLIAVALVACYVPARRAMRVDPMIALRYE